MAATTQPTIAHGIARLHPDWEISSQYAWGPEWSLPPNRTGRWVIDKIYNAAIRVEFDPGITRPNNSYSEYLDVRDELARAREALSAEEEKRRDEWLGYADKRESMAFVRQWNARKRREYDMPTVPAGAYVRNGYSTSGVWHIATGRVDDVRDHPDILAVRIECSGEEPTIDLGDPKGRTVAQTTDPEGHVCKRCLSRVSSRVEAAPERQEALVTA